MCGIVGACNLNGEPVPIGLLKRMTDIVAHRGPDGEGHYTDGPVGLGHRRLAIIDLSSAGQQPMTSADGELVIVFNGEIYNYVELRNELETLGHTFRSSGDTEVLLHAYMQWGGDCLSRLNGMWAFLIHDKRRGIVFGSRDRFGIKPLFWYRDETHVLFGSEIKSIRASGWYRGGPNWANAARLLLQHTLIEEEESFITGIKQVLPGMAFELDMNGRIREWRYWSLDFLPMLEMDDPVEAYRELFEDAVHLCLRSDVPVAVFLSGGMDSTSILCAAARQKRGQGEWARGPLTAFSFMPVEFDESRYILDTINQTRAELKRLDSSPAELWDSLTQVLWFHDEPVHSPVALVGFALARLVAANGTKVVLNGQGADETAAGYHGYFESYWLTLLAHGRINKLWSEIGEYVEAHGGNRYGRFCWVLQRLFRAQLKRMKPCCRLAGWKQYRQRQNHPWFTPDLTELLPREEPEFLGVDLNTKLKRSVERAPLPLYLRIEDRNSMAHSLEVRLPFLDYRLVSLLFNIPGDKKMKGPWNKYIEREAMRNRIPESVRSRMDKMGFPTPFRKWVSNNLYEPIRDILCSQQTRERGIYNVDAIVKDLELLRDGNIKVSGPLFHMLQVELWARMADRDYSVSPAIVG
jgi:asparagine synthase (glutamine-hydrolysing)